MAPPHTPIRQTRTRVSAWGSRPGTLPVFVVLYTDCRNARPWGQGGNAVGWALAWHTVIARGDAYTEPG